MFDKFGASLGLFALAMVVFGVRSSAAFFQLDVIECTRGQGENRIAACSRLLEAGRLVRSDRVAMLTSRADAYFNSGNYDLAIADYDDAIALNPDGAIAYNGRCFARAVQGTTLDQAEKDCEMAVRLAPNDPYVMDSVGFLRLRLGKYSDAILAYDAAINLKPGYASSLFGRGMAKELIGDPVAGRADIAAAQQADPDISKKFSAYGLIPY